MTKAKKEELIARIDAKLTKVEQKSGKERGFGTDTEAVRIFKITKAFHSAVVTGNQKKKHSADEMDEKFEESFSAIIKAIK
jgi:hypothetical protein